MRTARPSKVIQAVPSGVLYDFNFPKMTDAERTNFLNNRFIYVLGGDVAMRPDPDTGETILQMYDATSSHGVNTNLQLPVTQEDKMTYELRLKLLYQKQSDVFNGMIYDNGDHMTKTGGNAHNTWQVNFSQDPSVNENNASTKTKLGDSAFSIYFDPSSEPVAEYPIDKAIDEANGYAFHGNRSDGTREIPVLKFGTTEIGTYSIGRTGSPNPGDTSVDTVGGKQTFSSDILDVGNYILPTTGNGYGLSIFGYSTPLGDAFYQPGETLNAIWYYEKGSAKYMDLKVVVDAANNRVSVYLDNELVYAQGEFNKDLDPPYNIGKIELKSRNDGFSWVNVESIKVSSGDGTTGSVNPAPVPGGSTRPKR